MRGARRASQMSVRGMPAQLGCPVRGIRIPAQLGCPVRGMTRVGHARDVIGRVNVWADIEDRRSELCRSYVKEHATEVR